MTNGPRSPLPYMYVDGVRTNVIVCQALISTDTQTFGREAVGYITVKKHLKFGSGEVNNIRCVDTQGNIFDYPTPSGGYSSNDGKESAFWMSFYQYIGGGAFNPQPGSPVTISIMADLRGWQTGDVLEVSVDHINNIIAQGYYWSPTGEATSSILMLSRAAVIDSITIKGSDAEIVAHLAPNTSCDIEACSTIGGVWSKVNDSTLVSSESGEIRWSHPIVGGARFFRVAVHQ